MDTRHARHLSLADVGTEGQAIFARSTVAVVGAGGLGSPVLTYLCASGVGTLVVIDDDVVDVTNLQRQVIHTTDDVGRPKVESARDRLRALNPEVSVSVRQARVDAQLAAELARTADVVVDATDNFGTRIVLEQACRQAQTPQVYGAVMAWEGQVCTLLPGGPTLDDWFGGLPSQGQTGAQMGILAPLPGVIGSMMAAEVLKVLLGMADSSVLNTFDARTATWRTLRMELPKGTV